MPNAIAAVCSQQPVPKALGAVLWLDANDVNANGTSNTNNTTVATWKDKSGNNNHATQATGGNQPLVTNFNLNNRTGLYFNGSNYLTSGSTKIPTGSTARTICVVCTPGTLAISTDYFLFAYGTGVSNKLLQISANTKTIGLQIFGSSSSTTNVFYLNGTFIYIFSYTAGSTLASSSNYINNNSKSLSANTNVLNTTSSSPVIGASYLNANEFLGLIYEIMVFPTALTSTESTALYNYLAGKWNLTPSITPTLWLDSSDVNGNGSITTGSSVITTWTDKSGNTNNFTQATSNLQPTIYVNHQNNLPSISFTGTQYLSGTVMTATKYTIFIVGRTTIPTNTQAFFYNGNPTTNGFGVTVTNTSKFGSLHAGSGTAWMSTGAVDTCFHILCAVFDGTTATYYEGNLSKTLSQSISFVSPTTGATIGAGNSSNYLLTGDISEVLYYNTNLVTSQLTSIFTYLNNKWNVYTNYGPIIWLDGSDPATTWTLPAASSSVSTWVDKSSSGNNFTQSGASRPTFGTSLMNSLGGLQFTTSQTIVSSNPPINMTFGTNPRSYFILVAFTSSLSGNNGVIWSQGGGGSGNNIFIGRLNISGSVFGIDSGGGGQYISYDNLPMQQNTYYLFEYHNSNANFLNSTAYVNSVANSATSHGYITTNSLSSSAVTLNSVGGIAINVLEVVAYNYMLTPSQAANVRSYIRKKWNMQAQFAPVLWLDGADPNGLGTTTNSTAIGTWVDKSNNNNSVVQATTANKPTFNINTLNTCPTISFVSASTQYMTGSDSGFANSTSNRTVFYVVNTNDPTSQQNVFSDGTVASQSSYLGSGLFTPSGSQVVYVFTNAGYVQGNTALTQNGAYAVSYNISSGSLTTGNTVLVNGTTQTNNLTGTATINTTAGGIVVGANQDASLYFMNGNICEIIVYNYSLSASQMTIVANYLNNKWGT